MASLEVHTEKASQAYFNRWARRYDVSPAQIWFRANYRLMVRAVDPPPTARILDVGCGTGQLTAALAHRVSEGEVLGIDPAEEMIKVARGHTSQHDNLRFEVGRSDALPFEDAVIDVAVSTISFHHWTRPAKSIRELGRVLKPGGRLFVLDFCRDGSFVTVLDLVQRFAQASHHRIASSREMRRYLRVAGFRDVRITKPRCLLMLVEGTRG